MGRSFLTTPVLAIGLAVVVSACGASASASPPDGSKVIAAGRAQAGTPAGQVPGGPAAAAGQQRIGGAAQGISLEVPRSWVTMNFARQTLEEGLKKAGIRGASQANLAASLRQLSKVHAVYAVDMASVSASPAHFATNVNAYCSQSGVTLTGSAGIPSLRSASASQIGQTGALALHQADINVGGVPGVRTTYTVSTTNSGAVHGTQFEVLPRPDRACYVTVSASGPLPRAVIAALPATVEYP